MPFRHAQTNHTAAAFSAGVRRIASARRVLIGCGLALGLAVIGGAGLMIMHLRQQALATNQHDLQSMSYVLADEAERAFQSVDLLQTSMLERLHEHALQSPEDFEDLMATHAMYDDMRERVRAVPQLDAITAINADGKLINFSRFWPTPAINLADRDYFKRLSTTPGLRSVISEPVQNRGTNTWTIYLARAVRAEDGRFLGLLLGAVELSFFQRIYATAVGDTGTTITLEREDGLPLIQYPKTTSEPSSVPAAHGRSPAIMGEGQHLSAAHRVIGYRLRIEATRPLTVALATWRKQAISLGLAVLLLELVVIANTILILRQFNNQQALARMEADRARAEQAKRHAEADLALAQQSQRVAAALQQQHLRFAAALRNMTQALCMFDAENSLVVANPRALMLFHLTEADIETSLPLDMMFERAHERAANPDNIEHIAHLLRGMVNGGISASRMIDLPDGSSLSVSFQTMPGEGWLATIEDISERRQAEARIAHMAQHDALTGLPNRLLFHERLDAALARAIRGEGCAVLCLDLDHFKAVNDTLGHPIGDALLCTVTERLRAELRATDTVARLGGDEFAIVQSSIDQPHDAVTLAARLIDILSAPYEIGGHQIVIGTSIGIAVIPGDGDDANEILKNADLALYRAKAEGRGRFRCFEPAMDAAMQLRRLMELDLRKALTANELDVYYQPLIDMQSGVISGFEALLR